MIKQLTPIESRALAGINQTPLAQAYKEVQAPYWREFLDQWPSEDVAWFESMCLSSGAIAVADLTDDPDRILPKLLKDSPADVAAQILEHLEAGPDNFVLDMVAIAAAVPKADALPKPQPL